MGFVRTHQLVALLAGEQDRPPLRRQDAIVRLRRQPPPDGVRVEPGIGGRKEQDGGDEGDRRDAELDMREILQLKVRGAAG